MRVAAVGDLHCTKASQGALQPLFAAASAAADVLLLCGDLTDYGLGLERVLAKAAAQALHPADAQVPGLPTVSIEQDDAGIPKDPNDLLVLPGLVVVVAEHGDGGNTERGGQLSSEDLGLVGKGEDVMKRFVREAVEEALKLESALARLHTAHRVAMLHYSPIQATVEGESPELYPFLGSSRLEEPLHRYPVDVVFHGHAHHGRLEARTRAGVPVYNVCLPLLRALEPDRPPFRVVELPAGISSGGQPGPTPATPSKE